jgi:hypothetical protein
MATESREVLGREVDWLDRSLALTCAGGLAVTLLAGMVQVRVRDRRGAAGRGDDRAPPCLGTGRPTNRSRAGSAW